MRHKTRNRKVGRAHVATHANAGKFLWRSWPVLLIAAALVVGIVISEQQYFMNPSEAARTSGATMLGVTNRTSAVQRSAEGQGFIDEASRLFHEEYNRCYVMDNLAEKCKCMAGVVEKLEALRAKIIATGKDYQNLIDFWVNYYIKKIQETLIALGCDLNGNVVQQTMSFRSRLSRLFRVFSTSSLR